MADIGQIVGQTPLVELTGLSAQYGTHVWAKLEARNPGGSIKDRTAYALLEDAKARGRIHSDTVIIEATSGNTGIALAMACAALKLELVIFMPEGQSLERKQLFWAYGATVVETPADEHTVGAIRRAKELESLLPEGLMLRQHENAANPAIHEETTGPEIWNQTGGQVQVFVAGVGTGGTITGVGRYLKQKNPNIRIVAVEPEKSAVLSGNKAGSHQIQGIGAGFIPANLDMTVVDQIVPVPDRAAWSSAQELPREEGILAGLSSGAAYWAAIELLKQGLQNIVVIFADSGERYLSMKLYDEPNDAWLRQRVPAFFDKRS
ncbi:MAG: cysteine synthase A [Sulfobacillus acidophilus]|uniref:Cysteine synthase n=1 Tax=Sulfobacillus acidophilus TaxID=53633 RepID=A0A2T2WEU9_9FIRM|nr:MAG: cysteine synthase A [Sulfobacillus acidophilus]